MDLFFVVLLTFLVGFLTMKLAERRGRSGPLWFCLGVLGGIFAVIALLLLKPVKKEGESEEEEEEQSLFSFGMDRQEKKNEPGNAKISLSWDPALYDWYYLNSEKKQEGPISFQTVSDLWNEGKISLDTYVWYEELSEWKHLHQLTELLASLEKQHKKELPLENKL